jgi:DNA adenine methylase
MQYMGSKNRFAKELVPIIESYITSDTKGYLEPFVGGANMIDKIKFDKKYGCDLNEYLIELLKHIQTTIKDIPITISEEFYNNINKNKANYEKWLVGMVGFCGSHGAKFFNGYARGNDKRNRQNEAIRNLIKQSPNLKGITFKHCSFQEIKSNISGYVIYCDPPYKGTTKYKTDEFPYDEYYNWCRKMSKNNIVLCSEYWMPEDFECIWSKETKANFDCNRKSDDDKNNRIEKLFILKGNL